MGSSVTTSVAAQHGWRKPGLIDEIEARWSNMEDLPTEDATEEEVRACAELKAVLLRLLELTEVPAKGSKRWHHFTQARLLIYLRSRGGKVEDAAQRAAECIGCVDSLFDAFGRKYEGSPEAFKNVRDHWDTAGLVGTDRRGASIWCNSFALSDRAGA